MHYLPLQTTSKAMHIPKYIQLHHLRITYKLHPSPQKSRSVPSPQSYAKLPAESDNHIVPQPDKAECAAPL